MSRRARRGTSLEARPRGTAHLRVKGARSLEEVADRLRVSEDEVRSWLADGRAMEVRDPDGVSVVLVEQGLLQQHGQRSER